MFTVYFYSYKQQGDHSITLLCFQVMQSVEESVIIGYCIKRKHSSAYIEHQQKSVMIICIPEQALK